MTAEYQRPETRPTYGDVVPVATESPRFEAVRPVTALALIGIEARIADYVPDEFTRT
jgi:hypothetical protein